MNKQDCAKRIQVRVFAPGNKTSHAIHLSAPPGKIFTRVGIDSLLENYANDLEARFPTEEYRLVELGHDKFNFVWVETLAKTA